MSAVDRMVEALQAHNRQPRRSGDGWIARCPAHDDERPSLSFKAGDDGRVLLKCHAGCPTNAVVEALDLRMRDLFGTDGQRRIVATYDYTDEHGKLLFQVVRYEPKDFRQRRPDGQGGWVWNLKGVRRVLYRLPKLITTYKSALVYVVEGEEDADRLDAAALIATCCPGGAEKWGRLDDDSVLEGRSVVILPDADDTGRRHAEDVAARLHGRAASVCVVELPGLEDGQDVSDWLAAGNDPEDLDRLAAKAPKWKPGPTPAPSHSRNR